MEVKLAIINFPFLFTFIIYMRLYMDKDSQKTAMVPRVLRCDS